MYEYIGKKQDLSLKTVGGLSDKGGPFWHAKVFEKYSESVKGFKNESFRADEVSCLLAKYREVDIHTNYM